MKRVTLTLCVMAVTSPVMAGPSQGGIPVGVVAIHDGVGDGVSDDLSRSIRDSLGQQAGIYMVAGDRVAAIMAYQEPSSTSASAVLEEASALMARAKEHFLQFASDPAQAEIDKALQLLRTAPLPMGDKGPLLRDALVTAAIIHGDGGRFFGEVLRIDPQYQLNDPHLPPRLRRQFSEMQKPPSTGAIQVDTDPKVAEVYLNGIAKGVTPLRITGLPEGDYELRIATNRYTAVEESIRVVSGETAQVTRTLRWKEKGPGKTAVAESEVQHQIAEGAKLTRLMQLQKLVMVDVDPEADGSGEIRARMVDATTQASHRPIVVQYRADRAELSTQLSRMVVALTQQATLKRIDNPVAQLDPIGVGDPIVLGRRRHRGGMSPMAWGVVGGVVGGGTLAGVLAAVLSSGGGGSAGSGTGSVSVQFK